LPDTLTMRDVAWDCWVNVAVTVVADLSVTLQEPEPLHAPPHPVKVEPAGATAARVTVLPYP
jgi:hypothetical protein